MPPSVSLLEKQPLTPKALNGAADFETAIKASGFGKFNYLLFLIAIPAGWAAVFEVTTMSYVFPAAQCDLKLNLDDKGLLNAITYAGMASSGFVWGFLCDSFGRRSIMATCFLMDAFFVILSALSQNVTVLIVSKFFGGMIVNGPSAALTAYISEFHGTRHRSKVQMYRGTVVSFGSLVLPLLAWAIIPLKINFSILGSLQYHSWNLYLLVSALPSLLSGIGFMFMPESPKFLMSIGQNRRALKVFRQVYSINTGLPSDHYPIKKLLKEVADNSNASIRSNLDSIKEELVHFKSLFMPPHLVNIVLVCVIQLLNKASLSPLKLWLPQIFQAISDYYTRHNGTSARLCVMLAELELTSRNTTALCQVNLEGAFVYINTMVSALIAILGYILAGHIINALGDKRLLIVFGMISAVCAMATYFAKDSFSTLMLTSSTTALGSVCANALLTIVIEIFPTRLRTTAISLVMMMNKGGSMIGNLLFPILLQLGCAPPFFFIGFAVLVCTLIAFLLPGSEYSAFQ